MKVKFTRIIEQECEVDIPLSFIESQHCGYVEDAVEDDTYEAEVLSERVSVEDIESGDTDKDDKEWQDMMDRREQREIDELTRDYYASLGIK